jgi:hypothetical protein
MIFTRFELNLVSNFYLKNLFEHRRATWLFFVGPYQFARICTEGRQIKRWMDAPDHPIPLHLSEVFWSDGSRSNGRKEEKGRELT